ncbi:VOC family protein [Chungangia koreensis]|uniref:VOC family protein n=1 Tax=Chungangia koreensis TaxID=752657 RepID=A0ABV8X4V4_9LACT
MLLDHIVHFIDDELEAVMSDLVKHKLNAVKGGSHEQWGTYNSLLYTRNSYIEFLAVEDKEVLQRSNHPLIMHLKHDLPNGSGFGTICIRTTNIEGLKKVLESKGLHTTAVFNAQRRTTTGDIRKWKMLFIDEEVGDSLPFPFFIEWEEPDSERYEALIKDGTVQESNLKLTIDACHFQVAHPRSVAAQWGEVLGIKPTGEEENELVLPNSKLIFQHGEEKERLKKVVVAGHEEKLQIEVAGGVYEIGKRFVRGDFL